MRSRVAAAALVAALSISSCSAGPAPAVAWPDTAAASGELPYGDAPRVNEPMTLGKLAGDPCVEALTPTQVEFAVGAQIAGRREDLAQTGPACSWFNGDTTGSVAVYYILNTHEGLSAVYANTRPQSAVWRVLPDVQGFPAVAHASDLSLHFCVASVGVRDDTSIDVSLTLAPSKWGRADACELVRVIAYMAVTTVNEQAG